MQDKDYLTRIVGYHKILRKSTLSKLFSKTNPSFFKYGEPLITMYACRYRKCAKKTAALPCPQGTGKREIRKQNCCCTTQYLCVGNEMKGKILELTHENE